MMNSTELYISMIEKKEKKKVEDIMTNVTSLHVILNSKPIDCQSALKLQGWIRMKKGSRNE